MTTMFHRALAPVRRHLGPRVAGRLRAIGTAVLTPIHFSRRSGHFTSSLKTRAVTSAGEPLPWYSYPAIDFLRARSFVGRSVLELGAGQSTLWWAHEADRVLSLEGDVDWFARIATMLPPNVDLRLVTMESGDACLADVRRQLSGREDRFDVVVIDGLYRKEMVEIAIEAVKNDGAIICDNAEGYGFHEAFLGSGMSRVDFFGHAPGVMLPHSTSIYFRPGSFLFASSHAIPGAIDHDPQPVMS